MAAKVETRPDGLGFLASTFMVVPMSDAIASDAPIESDTPPPQPTAAKTKAAGALSGALVDADDHMDVAITVGYFQDEKPTLVSDLRAAIAEETGTHPEQLRMVLRGAKHRDMTKRGLTDFTLHDTEPLMDWHLDDTEVLVEVKKKQRAGKSLHRPGNGWFKIKKGGRTCTMNIAGAIVKQMIFSKANQYSVTVEEPRIFPLIMELCDHYCADAVVLAAADADALPAEAEAHGFSVEADGDTGVTKLVSAQRRLTVVSERDDPDFSKDMLQGTEDPDLEKLPAVVHVPEEAVGSKLIFVLGGDVLRETGSLTKVIRSLRHPSGELLTVFHLVTSTRHKLHLPSLGFVVRMRDRFGCDIPQLPGALLDRVLPRPAETASGPC
ncbi:unnamed protein product [Symbiodinium natans]|uniref:Ubiquitin-like domain-containing protein n=1 Tax=Symbiodinium natans TaxID=878477 RepID=A0A812L3J3_9DINO|nr:unnamed protein product [Symbiodinium natans]